MHVQVELRCYSLSPLIGQLLPASELDELPLEHRHSPFERPDVLQQPRAHAAEQLAALGALRAHLPHKLTKRRVPCRQAVAVGLEPSVVRLGQQHRLSTARGLPARERARRDRKPRGKLVLEARTEHERLDGRD